MSEKSKRNFWRRILPSSKPKNVVAPDPSLAALPDPAVAPNAAPARYFSSFSEVPASDPSKPILPAYRFPVQTRHVHYDSFDAPTPPPEGIPLTPHPPPSTEVPQEVRRSVLQLFGRAKQKKTATAPTGEMMRQLSDAPAPALLRKNVTMVASKSLSSLSQQGSISPELAAKADEPRGALERTPEETPEGTPEGTPQGAETPELRSRLADLIDQEEAAKREVQRLLIDLEQGDNKLYGLMHFCLDKARQLTNGLKKETPDPRSGIVQVEDCNRRIADLERELQALKNAVPTPAYRSVEGLESDKRIADLERELQALKNAPPAPAYRRVDTPESDKRITDLERELQALKNAAPAPAYRSVDTPEGDKRITDLERELQALKNALPSNIHALRSVESPRRDRSALTNEIEALVRARRDLEADRQRFAAEQERLIQRVNDLTDAMRLRNNNPPSEDMRTLLRDLREDKLRDVDNDTVKALRREMRDSIIQARQQASQQAQNLVRQIAYLNKGSGSFEDEHILPGKGGCPGIDNDIHRFVRVSRNNLAECGGAIGSGDCSRSYRTDNPCAGKCCKNLFGVPVHGNDTQPDCQICEGAFESPLLV